VGTRFDVGYGEGDREDSCNTVDRSNGVGGTLEGDTVELERRRGLKASRHAPPSRSHLLRPSLEERQAACRGGDEIKHQPVPMAARDYDQVSTKLGIGASRY